jgi:hypothetical protein
VLGADDAAIAGARALVSLPTRPGDGAEYIMLLPLLERWLNSPEYG